MKKCIILYSLLMIMTTSTFCQIDKTLQKYSWGLGKTKTIFNHDITRISGKNNTIGVTNVAYMSHDQCIEEINSQAKNEMWTQDKLDLRLKTADLLYGGGKICLYITRLTISAANFEYFSVIIKDSAENEIYREQLPNNIPQIPSYGSDYWWNYTEVYLAHNIHKSFFFVYIVDALGGKDAIYKFKVKR